MSTSFAISFAIKLDKTNTLSGKKHPIVLQIIFDRKVRRKRLGMSANIHQWDFNNDEFAKGVHGRREFNKKLEEYLEKAEKIYQTHFEGKYFDYKTFIDVFSEKKKAKKKVTVIEFSMQVFDRFMRSNKGNTANDYKYLAYAIRKVAPDDLTFEQFTKEWLEDFEEYYALKGVRCFKYMMLLRSLYNKAIEKRLVDFRNNPFKSDLNPYGYNINKLKKAKGKINPNRIKDLSEENLLKIFNYKPVSENEGKYLAIWLFSYYTFGVNLTDIAHLQRSQIKGNRWYYSRSKTGVGLKKGKPLLPEAMEIIEKYDTGGKYVFDILNGYDDEEERKVNRIHNYSGYITKACKRISKRLDLDGYFTFYSARHTSATIALNSGADKNTVSHLLDHKNFSTIDNYAGRANDENVLNTMKVLTLKGGVEEKPRKGEPKQSKILDAIQTLKAELGIENGDNEKVMLLMKLLEIT